jgi:hypothetical protein
MGTQDFSPDSLKTVLRRLSMQEILFWNKISQSSNNTSVLYDFLQSLKTVLELFD